MATLFYMEYKSQSPPAVIKMCAFYSVKSLY